MNSTKKGSSGPGTALNASGKPELKQKKDPPNKLVKMINSQLQGSSMSGQRGDGVSDTASMISDE